jgi:hypothetical protein
MQLVPTSFAAQITAEITTYVEGTTEEPYIKNKKLRNSYNDEVWRYFRQFGLYRCRYAFCDNLEVNLIKKNKQ